MNKKTHILSDYASADFNWIKPGYYALCLTLFLMPFPRSWSLYPMGATLFFGMIAWKADFKNLRILFLRKLPLVLPLISYFLIHAVYLVFFSNWINVGDKLMFILVPVLVFPVFISEYFTAKVRLLFFAFLAGILVICLYQFIRASSESISFVNGAFRFDPFISPGVSRFNWDQLSTFESPTYISIKTLWAVTLVLFANKHLKIRKIWQVLLLLLYSIFIYFLGVRAGVFIFGLLIIVFILSRLKSLTSRIIFVLLIPIFFFVLFKVGKTNERMNLWIEHVKGKIAVEKVDWKNIEPRTRSWYSSMNLIKDNPLFGVGLNSREILAEEHRKQGFNVEADVKLNAHNQFIETQLALGIPGSIILLWMLLTPLVKRNRLWNPVLVIPFLIIITVSMIFESILVRQWGIMFFVLFYCIITVPDWKSE